LLFWEGIVFCCKTKPIFVALVMVFGSNPFYLRLSPCYFEKRRFVAVFQSGAKAPRSKKAFLGAGACP